MPLKINAPDQLELTRDDQGMLRLPRIVIEGTEPLPFIASYMLSFPDTEPALAEVLKRAYRMNWNPGSPQKLGIALPVEQHSVQAPPGALSGKIVVDVYYYDPHPVTRLAMKTDENGRDAERHVRREVVLAEARAKSGGPEKKPSPAPPFATAIPLGPSFPGWIAVDFGTSNSAVAVYDPADIRQWDGLPPEQERRLRDLLTGWVQEPAADAVPGAEPPLWDAYRNQVAANLGAAGVAGLVERLHDPAGLYPAARQLRLDLRSQAAPLRRPAELRLSRIYREVFRVPLLGSHNLRSAKLTVGQSPEVIPSETEIVGVAPIPSLLMGRQARQDRLAAFAQTDGEAERGRFHPAPKVYFGVEEREFRVSLDGAPPQVVTSRQIIRGAWAHLIGLAQKEIDATKKGNRPIRQVIVTYPTAAPPQMRREIESLRDQFHLVAEVVTDYDEAVSAAIFFLLREFGGDLGAGLEAFRARCRRDGPRWVHNMLVVDVGGGTTDLALIQLGMEEVDPFKPGEDRGAGGRYYVITPQLLGSSGNLQLGGEWITLRVFHLLKAALADHLLTLHQQGALKLPALDDALNRLQEPFKGDEGYVRGSILKAVDRVAVGGDADYRDGRKAAETVLPTAWANHPQRMQAFFTLWDAAEAAKRALGSCGPDGRPPEPFVPDPAELATFLRQAGVLPADETPDPAQLRVALEPAQFERAVRPAAREVAGIIRGLLQSRLPRVDEPGGVGRIDWLVLSGQTCHLDAIREAVREMFAETGRFVWNPERVTFVPAYAKLATAVGACYAEKIRRLRPDAAGAKPLLQAGHNQVSVQVRNLFFFLPCDFELATETSPLPVFRAGAELRQLDRPPAAAGAQPAPASGKARSAPMPPVLDLTVRRKDYEGKLTLWGVCPTDDLRRAANLTEEEFRAEVRVQFEVDHRLGMVVTFWRGERPHYAPGDEPRLSLPAAPEAAEGQPAEAGRLGWDVAVNVAQAVPIPGAEHILFRAGTPWSETFHFPDGRTCAGLVSEPLPPFPRSGRHDVYARRPGQDWTLVGQLARPEGPGDYPPIYRATVAEDGTLGVHFGEVPYKQAAGPPEFAERSGWVLTQPLELQPRDSDDERDPYCGLH